MEPTSVDGDVRSGWTRLGSLGALLGVIGAALILVGALQTTEAGGGNLPCPEGTYLVAQLELEGGQYHQSEGTEGVVTVEGDESGGTWTSTTPISAVIVKGGPDAFVTTYYPPATEGTFSNEGLPPLGSGNIPDISNVRFCAPEEGTTTTEPDTTTTTEEDTTTTTESDTTTTTDDTTTTTEGETTTTESDSTTTSESTTSSTEASSSTSESTTTSQGPEVGGVTVTSLVEDVSGVLPRTGAPSVPMIVLGALLVVAGIVLVSVERGASRRSA